MFKKLYLFLDMILYKLILYILKQGELINMVDLKAKPYNLDEEGIKWVEETIENMTI